MIYRGRAKIDRLIGVTVKAVRVTYDQVQMLGTDGTMYMLAHDQDCCEEVSIESIDNDISLLEGQTILEAYESTNSDNPPDGYNPYTDSYTWTFFHIRTQRDSFTIRFFGSSNGYYSETADLFVMDWDEKNWRTRG